MWARAIKSNQELAASYKDLGSNRNEQRAFRQRWARGRYQEYSRFRTIAKTSDEFEDFDVDYMTFSQLVWTQKCKVGACEWMKTCIEKHKAGQLFGTRRLHYVQFNDWNKKVEFLYWRRKYRTSTGTVWTELSTEKEKIFELDSNPVPKQQGAAYSKGTNAILDSACMSKPLGNGKVKGKDKDKSTLTPGDGQHEQNQNDEKRALDAQWGKAKKLKVRYDSAMSVSGNQLGLISNNSVWSKVCAALKRS